MKRMIAVLLLVTLLVAILPTAALAASKTKVYRVNTKNDPLIVHSTPKDKKTNRIGRLPKNSALIVLKTSGKWYRVKSMKGMTGWVYKKYVKAGAYAIVSTKESGLNIRKTINGKILGSAPKNAKVLVQYISGDWANVLYQKLDGWSYRSYLTWVA